MNKDQKWNLTAFIVSFLITLFIGIIAIYFISNRNIEIIFFLIAMLSFIFAFLYAVTYVVPKSILKMKKERKLVKIRHISENIW